MKTLTTIASILLALAVSAETKKFAWEDTNPPGIVTNFIFRVTTIIDTNTPLLVVNTGTNQIVTVENLVPGQYFANVVAQASATLFSPPSTNVLFTVKSNPTTPINISVSSVVNVTWTNNVSSGNIRVTVP